MTKETPSVTKTDTQEILKETALINVEQPTDTPEVDANTQAVVDAIREKVGTNSAKLPWPQDRNGTTLMLRREGARSIGRIGGREDRLALVLETLEILRMYAIEKYEAQIESKAAKKERADARQAFKEEQAIREAKAAISEKRKQARANNAEAKRLEREFNKREAALKASKEAE